MRERSIDTIIRPAAVLPTSAARAILTALADMDVSRGGVWNASTTLWQRYDHTWDGAAGMRGGAVMLGTIAVMYDHPRMHEITIYKVSVAEAGVDQGWTTESLCDDALKHAGLTLATCPRAPLAAPPTADPFRDPADDERRKSLLQTDVGTLLRKDVRELFGGRRAV
ncbi:MAG TPA: hypothetical protein VNA12_02345 [Mycobacteriales bacterium]|nr:hypothetical protein [Mycobacteriales bacterium]